MRTLLKTLGLNLEGGDEPEPSDYAQLLKKVRQRPDAQLLQTVLLRSMQQAIYSPHNSGHFGLAYKAYTHFTSPIRRYPDLLVHRSIKAILDKKPYAPVVTGTPDAASAPFAARAALRAAQSRRNAAPNEANAAWEKLGLLCSANERRADDASRDVEAWLKSYYMRERVGETFSGTVSSVAPFGIFIVLDDLFVEGLVHVSELGLGVLPVQRSAARTARRTHRPALPAGRPADGAGGAGRPRGAPHRVPDGQGRYAQGAAGWPRRAAREGAQTRRERRRAARPPDQDRAAARSAARSAAQDREEGQERQDGAQGQGTSAQAGAVMTGRRILAGFHAVAARLRHAPESIEAIYVDARRRDGRMVQLQQRAAELKVKVVPADPDRLRGMAGEAPHQGVVAVAAHLDQSLSLDDVINDVRSDTLLLLLDGVTDPRNLGACLRVADAAGVQAVIVPRDRAVGLDAGGTEGRRGRRRGGAADRRHQPRAVDG